MSQGAVRHVADHSEVSDVFLDALRVSRELDVHLG
jgi:hypothetical protein